MPISFMFPPEDQYTTYGTIHSNVRRAIEGFTRGTTVPADIQSADILDKVYVLDEYRSSEDYRTTVFKTWVFGLLALSFVCTGSVLALAPAVVCSYLCFSESKPLRAYAESVRSLSDKELYSTHTYIENDELARSIFLTLYLPNITPVIDKTLQSVVYGILSTRAQYTHPESDRSYGVTQVKRGVEALHSLSIVINESGLA